MYFWRINDLKRELAAGPMQQRSTLSYLLWFGGVTTAGSFLPLGEFNVWDYIDSVTMVAAFLLGAIYLYRCNGADSGNDFLARYVALQWVFGIRFSLLVILPVLVVGLTLEGYLLPGGIPEHSTVYESGALAGLQVAYYVWLGRHFQQVGALRAAV